MTRRYGKAPFRAAAIHGGPGAVGSAGGLAEGLAVSASCGVLEPFQSKETIPELEAELEKQLAAEAAAPVALIGHSWGAWLAALFAAEHPERVSKLILVGSGPLHSRYVPQIGERRLARLDGRRRERFQALLAELDSPDAIDRDALLAEFGALCTASDVYAPADPPCPEPPSHCDGRMYARVWAEAAALRESGELLRRFSALRIPVTVIHGEADPHPPEGVAEPLREAGVSFSFRLLPRCGHTPWREQYARGPFFDLLAREL